MNKLQNKTAIISGAASGIGKGIACAFAEEGAKIVIADTNAEEIYNTLLSANVEDKGARKKHVQSVKQNKKRRDNAVASGRCPRCGGKLVLREGRYGRFYGCFRRQFRKS